MTKPFLKAGYAGLSVIILSAVLIAVNPVKEGRLPQGFYTPVVAFEFAETGVEVSDLFGDAASGLQLEIAGKMKLGTIVDYAYILAYGFFLFYFSIICRGITGEKWFIISGVISLCVMAADFSENIQLLSIIEKLQSGEFEKELILLNYYTWAKWGGLSALFISLIPFLRKTGIFGRVISIIALISAVTGSAAYLHRSVLNEIYVLTVAVEFLMLIIFSFTFKTSPDKQKTA